MTHDIYFEPPSKSERDADRREEIALEFAKAMVADDPFNVCGDSMSVCFDHADAFLDEAKRQREGKP